MMKRIILLAFTALMAACSPQTATPTAKPPAEPSRTNSPEAQNDEGAIVLFHNGPILTIEDGAVAEAIAIKGAFILAVGSYDDVAAAAGPDALLVDLGGNTLMPGFVDPHSHVFAQWQGDPQGAQNDILSKGITAYGEMNAPEEVMQSIVELDRAGELKLRVSLYPAAVDVCGNVLGTWYFNSFPVSLEESAMLQVPGVKIFNDGGACNAPAVSYSNEGIGEYGDLYLSIEELTAIIIENQNHGYQVAIHSLGDRAIEVTQKAIIAALDGGENILHHRIEHNAILRDDLLTAYSEYDIVALIFGSFPSRFFSSENYSTPPEYSQWEWRWRALIESNPGAHIAWHADYPPMGPQDPFLHLYGFVTRQEKLEDGTIFTPPGWAADDLVSVEEALPMMTIEAAYAIRRENEIGSLATGKLADLIIISHNPLEINPEEIPNIEVKMTMVGGEVVFCGEGHDALCP